MICHMMLAPSLKNPHMRSARLQATEIRMSVKARQMRDSSELSARNSRRGLQHVEQNMYEYICLVDTVECMQRNCAHVRECLHDFYLICILPLP